MIISTLLSIGLMRGVLTLLLMLAFIGMVVRVYSRQNRALYDAAAAMPLQDDASLQTLHGHAANGQTLSGDKS